ncbi:MAG: 4-hydroxythreonine-4-phosphate dehydrogenase PdxA [Gammaproteobacteria bacterium]|nr:4-hydroxythreonine-4-phosphate dehydrogenase PdxA [Gammaproteobacteria bacterium]
MQPVPRIAVTPGEPAGIGPEIVLKLAQQTLAFEIVAVASKVLLESLARQLRIDVSVSIFNPEDIPTPHNPGRLKVVDIPVPNQVIPGELDVENSNYVIETLNTAIGLARADVCQAVATGPVQKSIINEAGIFFSGHTEFFAERTGGCPVMLLSNEMGSTGTAQVLRVALMTTHLAVADVPARITAQRIEEVLGVLHHDLINRFGIENPHISVCGLNPHAGEDGHLGSEEKEIIGPALDRLRKQDMQLEGPIPADTAFARRKHCMRDVIVVMYHDQGLPVIKYGDFGNIVNVTLGLPLIRTSVDHGTALDIAGQGIADAGSIRVAAEMAAKLADTAPGKST